MRDHKAWLGYVQQEGLVVSPAALVDAQVVLDRVRADSQTWGPGDYATRRRGVWGTGRRGDNGAVRR